MVFILKLAGDTGLLTILKLLKRWERWPPSAAGSGIH